MHSDFLFVLLCIPLMEESITIIAHGLYVLFVLFVRLSCFVYYVVHLECSLLASMHSVSFIKSCV